MTEHLDVVNAVIAAWKNDDIDGVLACLHDDIEYHYVVGLKPLQGKQAFREFLEVFGKGQSDKQWRIVNAAVSGDKLLVEGVDDFVDADGNRVQLPYMGTYEIRDGLIYRWRDYVDTGLAAKAKEGAAAPDYLQPILQAGL